MAMHIIIYDGAHSDVHVDGAEYDEAKQRRPNPKAAHRSYDEFSVAAEKVNANSDHVRRQYPKRQAGGLFQDIGPGSSLCRT